MEDRLKAVIFVKGHEYYVDIFGYTTKGVPGVEIIGARSFSRPLKEKLIYLSKMCQIRFPRLRYVLCIETDLPNKIFEEGIRWCELPLLILFWSLANIIPLKSLSGCVTSGKLSVQGDVVCPVVSDGMLKEFLEDKVILPPSSYSGDDYYLFDLEMIFQNYSYFSIKTIDLDLGHKKVVS
jgi:hypothetical protein